MIECAAPERTGYQKWPAQERRSIVKQRGYQPLCVLCHRDCKVYGAPNSTFKCFKKDWEEND